MTGSMEKMAKRRKNNAFASRKAVTKVPFLRSIKKLASYKQPCPSFCEFLGTFYAFIYFCVTCIDPAKQDTCDAYRHLVSDFHA